MDVFYARLFAAAPAVRPLFAGTDLRRQKGMLLGALVLLRKSLRDLDRIVPALRDMGRAPCPLRRSPEHYPVVGEVRSPRWPRSPATTGATSTPTRGPRPMGSSLATMIEGAEGHGAPRRLTAVR